MSHSDANCAKPRTGFRSRPADPWKLGARSLPEQQPPPARAPGGHFLIESAILSFPLHPLRPHNARTRARGRDPIGTMVEIRSEFGKGLLYVNVAGRVCELRTVFGLLKIFLRR